MESKPVAFQFTKAVKKSAVVPTSLNSSEKTEEVDFVKLVDNHGIERWVIRCEQPRQCIIEEICHSASNLDRVICNTNLHLLVGTMIIS